MTVIILQLAKQAILMLYLDMVNFYSMQCKIFSMFNIPYGAKAEK